MVISSCVGDLADTTLDLNWNITSLFLVRMMSGLSGELVMLEVGMAGSESLKKRLMMPVRGESVEEIRDSA